MCSLVSFQAVGTEETLVTLGARVGPDTCVVAQVDGQVARLSELLATVGTLKRLMTCVETFMFQKLGMGKETLPTVRAEVWSLT